MPLQKAEAIILKSQKQGETSKILTFYTRHAGKVKVIAKGARSSRSRYGGSLEPLNHVFMVYYQKENRDLQSLSQADIITSFQRTRQDLEKIALAMACCELVDRVEVGISPNPPLFRLLLETLNSIDKSDTNPANHFRAYEVRLLDILGLKPNLDACMTCRQQNSNGVTFDISSGGYTCLSCGQALTPGFPLQPEVLSVLRRFQEGSFDPNLAWSSAIVQQQFDDFLLAYLRYHVEGFYDLRAIKVLKSIRNRLANGTGPSSRF